MRHWFATKLDNSRTVYLGPAPTDRLVRAWLAGDIVSGVKDVREWVVISSPDVWRLA